MPSVVQARRIFDFDWIACNATNLFKDNWRQAEACLMSLV